MKKHHDSVDPDDVLLEYDFRHGVRGKYRERYADGSNVVVLEPNVARAFPNADVVNRALRKLVELGYPAAPER